MTHSKLSRSILVVDHDETVRTIVETCLRRVGHEVFCGSGRSDVLGLLTSRRFDLVITDALMPDIDGVEVVQAVERHQPYAAVLGMSGAYLTREFCQLLARMPGPGVPLMKPFRLHELLASVNQALGCDSAAAHGLTAPDLLLLTVL